MASNPHIPTNESTPSHVQVSEILLIIGLLCATADPDSLLHNVPFEISDLEKVETGITNMLSEAKSLRKFGVSQTIHRGIENSWKKVCLEVGFAECDINAFGEDWRAFVEAYATVHAALVQSGKPAQLRAPKMFPEALDAWSHTTDPDGNLQAGDDTDWDQKMQRVCKEIVAKVKAASAGKNLDPILEEDWCRRGRGGIVCVTLGMKWWRMSLLTSKNKRSLDLWSAWVNEMTRTFKLITEAQSM
jgi:hypothetical protein